MAQSRIERLVNLIAYLSDTRRSLTIHEIIESIPGYPENFASARRAFERDKEDLRSMGFEVTVEPNPSGESGYRINKDTTYFDIELDAQERNIIDYALENYAPEQDLARNAISKIGGNNPENDLVGVRCLPLPQHLDSLFNAISKKLIIFIQYKGVRRELLARKLIARSGFWYLSALDLEKQALRTFRLDRIEELTIGEHYSEEFKGIEEISPEDPDKHEEVVVKVNEALANQFQEAWKASPGDAKNEFKVVLSNSKLFKNSIFDYSGFVSIVQPKEFSDEISSVFGGVISQLEES